MLSQIAHLKWPIVVDPSPVHSPLHARFITVSLICESRRALFLSIFIQLPGLSCVKIQIPYKTGWKIVLFQFWCINVLESYKWLFVQYYSHFQSGWSVVKMFSTGSWVRAHTHQYQTMDVKILVMTLSLHARYQEVKIADLVDTCERDKWITLILKSWAVWIVRVGKT